MVQMYSTDIIIVAIVFIFYHYGMRERWRHIHTHSFCSPAYPGTHCLAQAGFKLTAIFLPQPPDCWDLQKCATTHRVKVDSDSLLGGVGNDSRFRWKPF